MLTLISLFFRFGVLGFGGPFAVIAMMEEELVEKRGWITADDFHQAFSLVKVLPGTTAAQLGIYLAYKRLGRLAGFLSGIAFVLPAVVAVLALSIFYARARETAALTGLFQGMQVGALLVIAESVLRMARPYTNSRRAAVIALIAGAAVFVRPAVEPFLILGFGSIGISRRSWRPTKIFGIAFAAPALLKLTVPSAAATQLALICLKTGFLVFGTGLAIVPVLEADVVTRHHWLTHAEFLDGLAIGQITPGPVVTTATFIGYKVAGLYGAFLATVAIFASAFFNPLVILPAVESVMRGSPRLKDFTDWAFPAVIGGIVATTLRLTVSTVDSWYLAASLAVLGVALFRLRPPAWAFIPLSGLTVFAVSKLL